MYKKGCLVVCYSQHRYTNFIFMIVLSIPIYLCKAVIYYLIIDANIWYIIKQEVVIVPPFIGLAIRTKPGVWEYVRVNANDISIEQITVPEYLKLKECLVDEEW